MDNGALGLDVHTLVDVGTLLFAVLGGYLSRNRKLEDSIAALKTEVAVLRAEIRAIHGSRPRRHGYESIESES